MSLNFKPLIAFGLLAQSCLWAGVARAQSYLSPGYVVGEIRQGLGLYSVPEAPEFVTKARPDPASLEYTPLKPPTRGFHSEATNPTNTLAAEASSIAELEAARANTQSRAAAAGAAPTKKASKVSAPPEEDPPPMKWNPWDTE